MRGDANLLEQVLFNLLDNAQKYGGGGRVTVHARRDGAMVLLSVTDEGPGVKPADLERIFEKFYRGGRADGRKTGTGLGLSISRGLIEAMGGRIWAESPAARRRGTRVVIAMPAAEAPRNRQGGAMSGARILIVDDEPQILRFLRPRSKPRATHVLHAGTGHEALRLIANAAPDLIVLDLGLPDMDGKEVIGKARQFTPAPIVVLSAREREAEKIAALDLGADDYVEKPFAIGELLARLRAALRHAKTGAAPKTRVEIDGLTIDMDKRLVTRDGAPIKLTPREYDLLCALAGAAGRVMTHGQILTAVWGPAHKDDTQYLRVFVGQLRNKIERDPSAPTIIRTEFGDRLSLRGKRSGGADADRTGNADAAEAAVAARVLGQILLVMLFREIERPGLGDLGGDRAEALRLRAPRRTSPGIAAPPATAQAWSRRSPTGIASRRRSPGACPGSDRDFPRRSATARRRRFSPGRRRPAPLRRGPCGRCRSPRRSDWA